MTVLVEHPQSGVALVRIDRAEARNALSQEIRRLLSEAFESLTTDEAVRAIVLTGRPEIFVAGADLKEFAEAGAIEIHLRRNHLYWRAIAECPKPVIAAVTGPALGGGCELAMMCDVIIAGEGAQFGQPEIRVGIMPGAGGTQRLVRAVGKFKAMKLLLTGKPIDARTAEAIGLVSEVVADDAVLPTALDLAATIAQMPPLAVRAIKEAVARGQDAPLDAALMLERQAFQLLFASADKREGMAAFLEKRRPSYEGR